MHLANHFCPPHFADKDLIELFIIIIINNYNGDVYWFKQTKVHKFAYML